MPLARAICGGWWAEEFTSSVPDVAAELYDTVCRAAEDFPGLQIAGCDVDRHAATVWYEKNRRGSRAVVTMLEAPMADQSNDPAAIWKNMIGEMEKGFNAFANQAMASPEFSKVVN